jgi:hypothetical protein
MPRCRSNQKLDGDLRAPPGGSKAATAESAAIVVVHHIAAAARVAMSWWRAGHRDKESEYLVNIV